MSKKESINLHSTFNKIFDEVCNDLLPALNYCSKVEDSVNNPFPLATNSITYSGNSTTGHIYNSNGMYIGDYPLNKNCNTLGYVPSVFYPQYIWIDIIEKTKCDDLKESIPKYPVSNFSIDKDGTSTIEIACSGFDLDELEVTREDLKIIVKGKRKDKEEKEDSKYLYKNIACRDFEISYDGSERWNFDDLDISLKKGILTIKIPLLEEYKPVRQSYKIK